MVSWCFTILDIMLICRIRLLAVNHFCGMVILTISVPGYYFLKFKLDTFDDAVSIFAG